MASLYKPKISLFQCRWWSSNSRDWEEAGCVTSEPFITDNNTWITCNCPIGVYLRLVYMYSQLANVFFFIVDP